MRVPFIKRILKSDKDETTEKALIAVAIILAAIAAGMALYSLWPADFPQSDRIVAGDIFPGSGDAVRGHLPTMTEEEIIKQMQREADRSVFSFKINSWPVFNDGASEGNLLIENPNHNIYPFVVEIFLNETQDKIYSSGGILPNHHISEAKLMKVLPQGVHEATAYIYVYDPKTDECSGKSAVGLMLTVNS